VKYFFAFLLIVFFSLPALSQSSKTAIKVLSAKDGFFHFKATGKFRGALVEVFDESRQLVAKTAMTKNKMLIDFFDAASGAYQIEISILETKVQFQYILEDDREETVAQQAISQVSFFENSLSVRL
jgi:hypothetical protein